MNRVQRYVLEIVMAMFLIMFILWAAGYICNAIYGMKFELQSCWNGVAALSGAGVLSMVKYIMDSWKNSFDGVDPYKKE